MLYLETSVAEVQAGPKLFDHFYNSIKSWTFPGKCGTNFILWIHTQSFLHVLNACQFGHHVSHVDHLVENPIFPCAIQHSYIDCSDGIPGPCLRIFNACKLELRSRQYNKLYAFTHQIKYLHTFPSNLYWILKLANDFWPTPLRPVCNNSPVM